MTTATADIPTAENKKTKKAKQVTMTEAIKQLVELAKGYVSYARKSLIGIDDYLSFKGKDISVWVSFTNDVWFVTLGDVEVTTNAHRIKFPYNYTINDLVRTCTLYTKYLDKLNTDLSKRTKEEIETERSAEIERLKSKLAELESGDGDNDFSPF